MNQDNADFSRKGLSPHTRGNLELLARGSARRGSIPAHTGKPEGPDLRQGCRTGLSPHTRGNLVEDRNKSGGEGSIPAHTGKPAANGRTAPLPRVYPRTHGETQFPYRIPCNLAGLSPHTRGNPAQSNECGQSKGSIPAHTGKPYAITSMFASFRVYPRTHGETVCDNIHVRFLSGLSPHTRGNLYKRIPLAPYNWTGNFLPIFTTFSPVERHQHHGFPWVDRRDDGGRGHRMQCYHATS